MTLWDLYKKCERKDRMTACTASLYVTGKLLMEASKRETDFFCAGKKDSFLKIWHLVCRFHEMGGRVLFEGKESIKAIPDFNLQNTPLMFGDDYAVTKSVLTEEELLDFYYYRRICCGKKKMDHGIWGGLLLYEHAISKLISKNEGQDESGRTIYAYAALTLMCHSAVALRFYRPEVTWRNDPLLCLLLFAEKAEPLHLCRGRVDTEMIQGYLDAICVQKESDGLVLTANTEIVPFDEYAEGLLGVAQMTGINISVEEKDNKIFIKW